MRVLPLLLLWTGAAAAQPLYGLTPCCPNAAVAVDAETGRATPIAEVGGAADAFTATVGTVAVDPAGGRAVAVRNGRWVRVPMDGGAVVEGPDARWVLQLAGVDGERGALVALSSERDTVSASPLDVVITNRVVAVDLATFDTTRVAVVGRARVAQGGGPDGSGDEGGGGPATVTGDVFGSVAGPAVVSGGRLHTVRNGRLVSVGLDGEGELLGPAFASGAEIAGVGESVYLLVREETPLEGGGTRTNLRLAEAAPGAADGTPLATVGTWTSRPVPSGDGTDGTVLVVEGDVFTASIGFALLDRARDRVWLRRKGDLVGVDLATGAETAGPPVAAGLRLVGGDAARATQGDPAPEAALRLRVFPSPARGAVTVGVEVPSAVGGTVDVFDAAGRHVRRIAERSFPAGASVVTWDASEVAPGVYVVRLIAGAVVETARVVVVR